MTSLKGKTLFVSGGSRGIGLAIARQLAERGANIALIAKTDTPQPNLPGTIHTAVSYTHLRAHETPEHLVCRLLLEKKKTNR